MVDFSTITNIIGTVSGAVNSDNSGTSSTTTQGLPHPGLPSVGELLGTSGSEGSEKVLGKGQKKTLSTLGNVVGSVVGGIYGGPIGSALGNTVGAMAGNQLSDDIDAISTALNKLV